MEGGLGKKVIRTKKVKKPSLEPKSSARSIYTPGSPRHTWSTGSQCRMSPISLGGSSNRGRKVFRTQRRAPPSPSSKVLDSDGHDVTPRPLYHPEQGELQSKPLFLDEFFSSTGSCHSFSTASMCSRSFMGSNPRYSSLTSTKDSPVPTVPIQNPAPCNVTEEMLDEVVDMYLSETDTMSLLDIPSTFVSEDSDDAEAIKERNIRYGEFSKIQRGHDKYVERGTQTFTRASKDKMTQSDNIVTVDGETIATVWGIYDSLNDPEENVEVNYPKSTVNASKVQKKAEEKSSSTILGSSASSLEMEICTSNLNAEPDPEQILLSESFQHSLLIMERNVVANILQPKLVTYKQLPVLNDPESMVKPEDQKQNKRAEGKSFSETLEHLWAFTCEITKGCNITSIAENKSNPDLFAVGYGDPSNNKPGFICCWSLKNPMWPDHIFQSHSCVLSLDFSACNPNQLAVGMFDGTVAIYNVQCQGTMAHLASSSGSSKKHMEPVWQVIWTKLEMGLSGNDKAEALISVSADGRVTQWTLCKSGFDCTDLMTIKRPQDDTKKIIPNNANMDIILTPATPILCIDFHPVDYSNYLIGTWDGLIHLCSFSHMDTFLTYKKHISHVSHIAWSSFSPDVFLSCSSDCTIKLWKKGLFSPVLTFTSTQRAVHYAKWSPNWSTVFAAVNDQQVEIWDLNSSILHPIIVHCSAPEVKMTTLLFATGTDCVLVGDSGGQVAVYEIKNLSAGRGKRVNNLEDILAAVSH